MYWLSAFLDIRIVTYDDSFIYEDKCLRGKGETIGTDVVTVINDP